MIIKNLDGFFQNVFAAIKASQKHSNLSIKAKFLLSFYNNRRCNKINPMAARRMDWCSLISIHKSAVRIMFVMNILAT